ncbi:MAG: DUF373 family protein [Candidatus Altiarchaeota archaeon]
MKPLVLCVDRDDDIGRKAGTKGPIIGREDNLEVAQKLALADPADTDVNALYGALKIADELKTDIVTLTGSEKVGVTSDREVARQLEEVMVKCKPESVIFVSDGMDDEQLIPIVQSRVKIDSVQRIVVRQSKELEKAYFKLDNFMREVTADPTLARLIFGLPGLILLLLGIGGAQALSLIMAVIGIYLIIKGFGWEEEFFTRTSEFLKSLSVERISTILYITAFLTFMLGVSYAYGDLQRGSLTFTDSTATLNTLGLFVLNSNSLNLIVLAAIIVISARLIDDWSAKRVLHVRRYLILVAFIVFIKIVLDSSANYLLNEEYGFERFTLNGLIGIISLGIWIKLTENIFIHEMEIINKLTKDVAGKEVEDTEGIKIGRVTRTTIENLELAEIRVGRRAFRKKDIVSVGRVIVVNAKKS